MQSSDPVRTAMVAGARAAVARGTEAEVPSADTPSTDPTRWFLSAWWRRGALWTLLTVVVLQPSPHRVSATVAGDLGDPLFLTWTLSWGAHALVTDPIDVMDANIFHPEGGMLALSDPMLSLAPVYGFLTWLTGDRITALNLLVIGLYVVALLAAFALGRRLFGRDDLALVVAVVACCNSYVFGQQNHPQLQTFGLVTVAFLALFRAIELRRRRDGVLLGGAVVVLALANLTYGLIFVVSGAVAVLVLGLRGVLRPWPSLLRPAVPAALVAGVVLGPVAGVYVEVAHTHSLERGYEPDNSLFFRDVLTPQPDNWLWGSALDGVNSVGRPGEHPYFPGLLVLSLLAAGVVLLVSRAWRSRADPGARVGRLAAEPRIDEILALSVAGAAALVLALGPEPAGFPGPFRFFHRYVPGFDGIRVTSRFAVVTFLAAAPLVALAVEWLHRRLSTRWLRAAVVPLVVVVVVAEVVGPMRRVVVPEGERLAVYEALEELPDGAVLELPIRRPDQGISWGLVEAVRMYHATTDFKPRVNGYSGGWPVGFIERAALLDTWPSDEADVLLDELGVRYIVLHTGTEQGYRAIAPDAAAAMAVTADRDGAVVSAHAEDWLIIR